MIAYSMSVWLLPMLIVISALSAEGQLINGNMIAIDKHGTKHPIKEEDYTLRFSVGNSDRPTTNIPYSFTEIKSEKKKNTVGTTEGRFTYDLKAPLPANKDVVYVHIFKTPYAQTKNQALAQLRTTLVKTVPVPKAKLTSQNFEINVAPGSLNVILYVKLTKGRDEVPTAGHTVYVKCLDSKTRQLYTVKKEQDNWDQDTINAGNYNWVLHIKGTSFKNMFDPCVVVVGQGVGQVIGQGVKTVAEPLSQNQIILPQYHGPSRHSSIETIEYAVDVDVSVLKPLDKAKLGQLEFLAWVDPSVFQTEILNSRDFEF